MIEEDIKYLLIYKYHDTDVEVFNNLSLLRLALANLNGTFRNDRDFSYKIYCAKDVTEIINELDELKGK